MLKKAEEDIMPGIANWQTLYKEEYHQLYEEGYPVNMSIKPDMALDYLPIPSHSEEQTTANDIIWERAYSNLWKIREKGLRDDYPYKEPNDLDDIFSDTCFWEGGGGLNEEIYRKRLEGAWFGRCAGVVLGKPLEMGFSRGKIREYLESVNAYPLDDWVPSRSEKLEIVLREDCFPSTRGNIQFVQPDDDIHYTVLALLLAEKKGFSFTLKDVGENWLNNVPFHWFWCASRQIYYHLVNNDDHLLQDDELKNMPLLLNPWRECIDGQIRTDFWGYINPGNPRMAACLAWQDCSLSLVKNGLYGGMFVAACIAVALTKNPTIHSIIQGGLSVIPRKSRLAEAVNKVYQWYGSTGNWEETAEKIEATYGHLPFAGIINNLSIVVLALLHGNLDYSKTITTAIMCGIDTDCNGGTAGSIAGAAVGIEGIDCRWTRPLNNCVKTAIADMGETTITALIDRTAAVRENKFPTNFSLHST
jgi:hypothetical protein